MTLVAADLSDRHEAGCKISIGLSREPYLRPVRVRGQRLSMIRCLPKLS